MEENRAKDTIIGFVAVLFLILVSLWYFEGFGLVLSGFKWLFATIFGAVISSVISTAILAVGAFVVLVVAKRYLRKKTGTDSL